MSNDFIVSFYDVESGEDLQGLLINSTYCAVRDTWVLLLHGSDNKLHTVHSNGVAVTAEWMPGDLMFIGSENDEDDDDD